VVPVGTVCVRLSCYDELGETFIIGDLDRMGISQKAMLSCKSHSDIKAATWGVYDMEE